MELLLHSSLLLAVITSLAMSAHAQPGRVTVDVRVHSYHNPTHTDEIGDCCDGSSSASPCSEECDNFFIICLQNYNSFSSTFFSTDSCPHGRSTTALIAENDDDLTFTTMLTNGASNVFTFTINDYPGRVQVAFRAQDQDGGNSDEVIGTVFINLDESNAYPGDGYTTPTVYESGGATNIKVKLSFRVSCTVNLYGPTCESVCVPLANRMCTRDGQHVCPENYYGTLCTINCVPIGNSICNESGQHICVENYYGPSCTVFCQDSDDDITGHYYCDDDGNRVCLDGYQNPSTNCVDCVPAEGCYQDLCSYRQPCQNGATCISDGPDMFQCECTEEYEGENCTLRKTNECTSNPCQNGGECIDLFQDFTCSCSNGYSNKNCSVGIICEHEQPCQNRATCINTGPDMYQCVCTEEYEGENCTLNKTDECDPNPCQNGGECTDLPSDHSCTCKGQWHGTNCEQQFCEYEQPCQNNGTCINTEPHQQKPYQCLCTEEYEGENCTLIKTDECDPNPCQNGGECIDLFQDFTCKQGNQSQLPLSIGELAGVAAGGTVLLVAPVFLFLLICCIWKRRNTSVTITVEPDNLYEMCRPTLITRPQRERADEYHEFSLTYENVNPIVPAPNRAYHKILAKRF